MAKVERYLRQTFANHSIRVVGRPKKADSAEVYIGEEFVGVLFLDDEDGDRSYNFTMAILDTDLEDLAAFPQQNLGSRFCCFPAWTRYADLQSR